MPRPNEITYFSVNCLSTTRISCNGCIACSPHFFNRCFYTILTPDRSHSTTPPYVKLIQQRCVSRRRATSEQMLVIPIPISQTVGSEGHVRGAFDARDRESLGVSLVSRISTTVRMRSMKNKRECSPQQETKTTTADSIITSASSRAY